jgi:hypothetical protein
MSEEEAVDSQQSTVKSEEQTPSPLRGTPPLQGESLNNARKQGLTAAADSGTGRTVVPERAGEDALAPKTQGVRANRGDGGRRVLEKAARAAARTGTRGDVHEYMRIRRSFV